MEGAERVQARAQSSNYQERENVQPAGAVGTCGEHAGLAGAAAAEAQLDKGLRRAGLQPPAPGHNAGQAGGRWPCWRPSHSLHKRRPRASGPPGEAAHQSAASPRFPTS